MADPTPTEQKVEREQAPPAAPVTPSVPSRWTGGRIAMIVGGTLLALVALGLLACGAYGLWLDTQRSDGYVMTSSERFSTGSYALATRTLHISSDVPSFLYGRDWLGDVRIRGQSANPNLALFIGIARKDEVDRYLAGVAHSEVVDVNANPFGTTYRPSYRPQPGGKPAIPPNRATFWVARVAGRGSQSLTWSVKQGRWAVVVMRPNGSRGVSADLAAGAKLPALLWASLGLLVLGILISGGAAALLYFGAREPRAPATPAA
jgi:hypothetical protein